MDGGKFQVEDDTGNTMVGGSLTVGDNVTISGVAEFSRGLKMTGDYFSVSEGSGDTEIRGSLVLHGSLTPKESIDLSELSTSKIFVKSADARSLVIETPVDKAFFRLNTAEKVPSVNVVGALASLDDTSAIRLKGGSFEAKRSSITRANPGKWKRRPMALTMTIVFSWMGW